MMSNIGRFKQFRRNLTPNDFDDEGKLTPSTFIYVCFIYLGKAFLILIIGLASMAHETKDIISILYPVHESYFFDLVIGSITLLVFVIFSRRKYLTGSSGLTKIVSLVVKFGIPILLILKIGYELYSYFSSQYSHSLISLDLSLSVFLLLNYITSTREQLFRTEV